MTNEMKLLTALCDALGFDVEEVQEQSIPSGKVLIPHEYKLTKRGEVVTLPVEGDFWGSIVKYIVSHADDIESEINDYGDLKPVLDYFNRNS